MSEVAANVKRIDYQPEGPVVRLSRKDRKETMPIVEEIESIIIGMLNKRSMSRRSTKSPEYSELVLLGKNSINKDGEFPGKKIELVLQGIKDKSVDSFIFEGKKRKRIVMQTVANLTNLQGKFIIQNRHEPNEGELRRLLGILENSAERSAISYVG